MANTSLSLGSIDYDELKASFVAFLKTQDNFKDYDFEGSNINQLMSLLAYNSHLNMFYTNMMYAENRLSTAQLRESISSKAKELNYVPRSARSAKATVNVVFTASGDNQPYYINKGSSFTTIVKNTSYVFTVPETIVCSSENTSFSFTTDIYEGVYVKESFVFDINDGHPKFKLANRNVDTTSLTIVVFEDNKVIGDTYTLSQSMLGMNERSKNYFIQPAENGYYEVLFGDGVVGKQPKQLSTIVIEYRITEGSIANGAREFSVNFDPTGGELLTTPVVTTINVARAGAEEETNESIKFYAPRHYQTQERAVTASDYEIVLKKEFPEIRSVSVFGGEEADPPRYGRVMIAIDIDEVEGIPDTKKQEYSEFIATRAPLAIRPIFIDPQYSFLLINSKVNFNINTSRASRERIKSLVTNSIVGFAANNLDRFGAKFRYSKLVTEIDDTDEGIVSNETEILMYKRVIPILGQPQNIDLPFDVPIMKTLSPDKTSYTLTDARAVHSSPFTYNGELCVLEDDGAGKVMMFRSTGDRSTALVQAGVVNYETGVIKLINFNITKFQDDYMRVYIRPREKDIKTLKTTILTIEPSKIQVIINPIRE